jgi:hypothetical protein
MALTTKERAEAHRARQKEKLARAERMEAALAAIVEKLKDRPGPLAGEVRAIAEEALA